MKLLAVCAALFPLAFNGQQRLEVGAAAGANLFFMRGNGVVESLEKLIGSSAELSLRYSLNNCLVRTALQLDQKMLGRSGKIIMTNGQEDHYSVTMRHRSLTIPVMAGICFGGTVRFSLCAGGFLSYMLSVRQIGYAGPHRFDDDLSLNYRKIDAGIAAESSVSWLLNERLRFSLNVSDLHGLTDVSRFGTINNNGLRQNTFRALAEIQYSL